MTSVDIRRFFRNRFEYYLDHKDASGMNVHDGARLTLREACDLVKPDDEAFPLRYERDMQKLCGHEYSVWRYKGQSYGDVARLLLRKLTGEEGSMPPVSGRWVRSVLMPTRS